MARWTAVWVVAVGLALLAGTFASAAPSITMSVKGIDMAQRERDGNTPIAGGQLVVISSETGADLPPVQRLWLRLADGRLSEAALAGLAADPTTCTLAECAAVPAEGIVRLAQIAILKAAARTSGPQPLPGKISQAAPLAPGVAPVTAPGPGAGGSADMLRFADAGAGAGGGGAGATAGESTGRVPAGGADGMALGQLYVSIAGVLVAAAVPLLSIWLSHRLTVAKRAEEAAAVAPVTASAPLAATVAEAVPAAAGVAATAPRRRSSRRKSAAAAAASKQLP